MSQQSNSTTIDQYDDCADDPAFYDIEAPELLREFCTVCAQLKPTIGLGGRPLCVACADQLLMPEEER